MSNGQGTGTTQAPHSLLHASFPYCHGRSPATIKAQHSMANPHTAATPTLKWLTNMQQRTVAVKARYRSQAVHYAPRYITSALILSVTSQRETSSNTQASVQWAQSRLSTTAAHAPVTPAQLVTPMTGPPMLLHSSARTGPCANHQGTSTWSGRPC